MILPEGQNGISPKPSLPGWTTPTLSASHYMRCIPSLSPPSWPSTRPALTGPYFSYAGKNQSWTQYSRSSLLKAKQRGRFLSLNCCPLCFGCSPGNTWLSGLGVRMDGSCPAFHPQEPLVQLCRPDLTVFFSHSVLISGIAVTQLQNLGLGLAELHENCPHQAYPDAFWLASFLSYICS